MRRSAETRPDGARHVTDLDSLYRDFHGVLVALARRYLGSESAAEELVSDAFERFIKVRPGLRSHELPVQRAYLCRIVRNLIARPKLVTVPLPEDDRMASPEPDEPPPWAAYESDDLRDAIVRLPESYRTVVVLAYFERLPHKIIAQRLGCTQAAVTMRLFKAKRKLKILLEQARKQKGSRP